MSVRILLVGVSMALLAFAPAPFPRAERRRESNDIMGMWLSTYVEYNGVVQANHKPFRIEMAKDLITFHTDSPSKWTLTTNPTASPASFTWGKDGQLNYVGSYKLQNGELTMIFAISGRMEDRPTNFDKPPYKYIFKRVR